MKICENTIHKDTAEDNYAAQPRETGPTSSYWYMSLLISR